VDVALCKVDKANKEVRYGLQIHIKAMDNRRLEYWSG